MSRLLDPLVCLDDARRADVRAAGWNGLDYVEVGDDLRTLCVHLLGPVPDVGARNVVIEGGRHGRRLVVLEAGCDAGDDAHPDDCLRVVLAEPGDLATYRLCLVALDADGDPAGPYPGFDERYACIEFRFSAACPSDIDCASELPCAPPSLPGPPISYLAKDYESFRQLIFDRLALLLPGWTERHVPDLGVTLVELLAYIGDALSYYQDAVATEAYLATSRTRISVRRHARLVDYRLAEGTAARAFVQIDVPAGDVELPDGAFFVSRLPLERWRGTLALDELPDRRLTPYQVFEPLLDPAAAAPPLRQAHDLIRFHTWGDAQCCLPQGATSATLRDGPSAGIQPPPGDPVVLPEPEADARAAPGGVLSLAAGDCLLLEEIVSPETGSPADADPTHRHVVRLTRVERHVDALYGQGLVEVEWSAEDALPFPLCISTIGPAPDCCPLEPISVARGNIVLVEHGQTVDEELDPVPDDTPPDSCDGPCWPAEPEPRVPSYQPPPLATPQLVFAEPVAFEDHGRPTPAARLLAQDPRAAVPELWLEDHGHHGPPGVARRFAARYDMLESGPDDLHVVVEMDDERRAHLRFGDDELGEAPKPSMLFTAHYRTGGGVAGNVGAGAICHLVAPSIAGIGGLGPRNPLPARGGVDPELVDDARLVAPYAFRGEIERAITADDYAALALRLGGASLQRTAAALRFTGSWFRADVVLDVEARVDDLAAETAAMAAGLERFRRIGHDLAVSPAESVPLDVAISVCAEPGQLRAHVRAAVLDALSSGSTRTGALGFFHPDALTLGQGIDMSRLIDAVMQVEGVASVTVRVFHRLGDEPLDEIANGFLPIAPLEVARLDNDPSAPENGRLSVEVGGGR
jgi:hypothetical protein